MKAAKFHRGRDQRKALIKSLADSLVLKESIKTTLPKAKAVAHYTEKLVSKAKKGQDSLHDRRMVIAGLMTIEAAHKLVDEIAPKLEHRNSGFFRVKRLDLRRGDGAQMASVSFVDELKAAKKKTSAKTTAPAKAGDKAESSAANEQKVQKPTRKVSTAVKPTGSNAKTQPKRSGIRGNR